MCAMKNCSILKKIGSLRQRITTVFMGVLVHVSTMYLSGTELKGLAMFLDTVRSFVEF